MPSISLSSAHCWLLKGCCYCNEVLPCLHLIVSGDSGPPCSQVYMTEDEATEQGPAGLNIHQGLLLEGL